MSSFRQLLERAEAIRRAIEETRAGMALRANPGRRRRKPPEAGIAVPALQPKGPLPKQGGAEGALEFGD